MPKTVIFFYLKSTHILLHSTYNGSPHGDFVNFQQMFNKLAIQDVKLLGKELHKKSINNMLDMKQHKNSV